MKLRLRETQLSLNNLVHFPTLKQLFNDSNDNKKYISYILLLKNEFMNIFADFQK
jgi:hypothetical protein